MRCLICRLKPTIFVPAPAPYVVFGVSVCSPHADWLTVSVLDGSSVRDILDEVKAGDW